MAAWQRADEILARVRKSHAKKDLEALAGTPRSKSSARLLRVAAQGERLDKRLWSGVAKVTGAGGNWTSLKPLEDAFSTAAN